MGSVKFIITQGCLQLHSLASIPIGWIPDSGLTMSKVSIYLKIGAYCHIFFKEDTPVCISNDRIWECFFFYIRVTIRFYFYQM